MKSLFQMIKNTVAEPPSFQQVTLNLKASGVETRNEILEGREYLVVPCVMLTEGVHNGSNGPLFYPEDELAKYPSVWNQKPVVVYHPEFASACDPEIIERQKIGFLMNTRWDTTTKRLLTECWIDEARANKIDNRVIEAIQNGDVMEVSTGLNADYQMEEGVWNDERYVATAINYRPDHLAILPDQRGACSIEDGAGLLRNRAGDFDDDSPEGRLLNYLGETFNKLSHGEKYQELNNALTRTAGEDAWVIEVWDDFFIYMMDGESYYQAYGVNENDEVVLQGAAQRAERQLQYKLSDGTLVGNINQIERMVQTMDRKAIVNKLIENADCPWTEDDRDMLMNLSDEKFKFMTANQEPKDETDEEPKDESPAPESQPETQNVQNQSPPKPMTWNEWLETAPPQFQSALSTLVQNQTAQIEKLVDKIMGSTRNRFSKQYLQNRTLEELEGIAALAEEPTQNASDASVQLPAPLFAGQAEVLQNQQTTQNGDHKEEPLKSPVLNFDDDEK